VREHHEGPRCDSARRRARQRNGSGGTRAARARIPTSATCERRGLAREAREHQRKSGRQREPVRTAGQRRRGASDFRGARKNAGVSQRVDTRDIGRSDQQPRPCPTSIMLEQAPRPQVDGSTRRDGSAKPRGMDVRAAARARATPAPSPISPFTSVPFRRTIRLAETSTWPTECCGPRCRSPRPADTTIG